ncbi:MAG: ABC transporter permease [Spirochaetes bacterium]|nr:ABC transporter permease [Spirochaetota bacterium]
MHSFSLQFGTALTAIGERLIDVAVFSGFTIVLLMKSTYYLKNIVRRRREVFRQMYYAGVKTLMVVSIVAMFTGMILTLQTGLALKDFNLEETIGNVLIATLTREMGPFSAAIILIASVGSAMAAEIGTMKVSEEIDALVVMSISPVYYLVMPRIVALTIMLPVATIYVDVLGVIGGAIIARSHLGIPFDNFYAHVMESLHFKPVYVGLFKATIFGMLISSISCAQGLRAKNGALGVGRATRNAVVASFLMVLIVGYYITEMFFGKGL